MSLKGLSQKIHAFAAAHPVGTPVSATGLLHFGTRAAVDQALARMSRRGVLIRIARGVYVRPVQTRQGALSPPTDALLEGIRKQSGEAIVLSGAAAANALGLTTQVPVREIYLTSGKSRTFTLAARTVELRHAPSWQLLRPNCLAGDVVRALVWLGPENAEGAIKQLRRQLPTSERTHLAAIRFQVPHWVAEQINALLYAAQDQSINEPPA